MPRERVKKGMEFLDVNVPDWRSRIDVEGLNMGDCKNCILGQLFGDYFNSPWPSRRGMGGSDDKPWSYDISADYGFAAGPTAYSRLTEAWKRELS